MNKSLTLAERRKMVTKQGGMGRGGEFIQFTQEGETKYIRFLFTDANTVESNQKFYNEETKEWEINQGKGSWRILFNCVEYDKGGSNPRRVRWELSEYLYNEYLSPYIEKDVPASKNVWEIKVRRPRTMDVSYIAFRVDDATEITYPIPELSQTPPQTPQTKPTAKPAPQPTYTQSTVQQAAPAPQQAPPIEQTSSPKSKYF